MEAATSLQAPAWCCGLSETTCLSMPSHAYVQSAPIYSYLRRSPPPRPPASSWARCLALGQTAAAQRPEVALATRKVG